MKVITTLAMSLSVLFLLGCEDSSSDNDKENSSSSVQSSTISASSSSVETVLENSPIDAKYDDISLFFNLSDDKAEDFKSGGAFAEGYVSFVDFSTYKSCLDLVPHHS